ncbi:MAG: FAD binding domain-containing protein [Planctomycetota bacterium]
MRDHLVFYVNGVRQAVRGEDAAATLSDFLRNRLRLTGTKIVCNEGDCGACTVLVGTPNEAAADFRYESIDACIAFVYQMDRKHVVTVEAMAAGGGPSDVQQQMIDCHGSQCGFCTPGFVMAMHGMVEERAEATDCEGPLGDDEMRLGLSGNLCRCTGYSQILEAGAGLSIEGAPRVDAEMDAAAMLADLTALEPSVHVNARSTSVENGFAMNGHAGHAVPELFLPSTLDALLARKAERPEAKVVAGATDVGVQHNHGKIRPTDILTTAGVEELHRLEIVDGALVIGAAVNWSRIERFVADRVPEYCAILERFGSPQVRHAGTLAGNLANASPIADSIPFHYAAESTIELASVDGRRSVAIQDFYLGYKQLEMKPEEIIVSVRTPLPAEGERLKLYKVSKRRDMDISTVTAALLLRLDGDLLTSARVAVGGVGPTVLRLPKAEAELAGRPFTEETMRAAGCVARGEVTPISDVRGSADYRWQLVENLFVKCFYDLSTTTPATV